MMKIVSSASLVPCSPIIGAVKRLMRNLALSYLFIVLVSILPLITTISKNVPYNDIERGQETSNAVFIFGWSFHFKSLNGK